MMDFGLIRRSKNGTSANDIALSASGLANVPFITSRNDFEFSFGDQIYRCSAISTDYLPRCARAFHAINNKLLLTKSEME
jgi:hypothetical protein